MNKPDLQMENRLNMLKEEFCKMYCNGKHVIIKCDNCDPYCPECEADAICNNEIEYCLCESCKVDEFIRHIRDELGGQL